MVLQMAWSFQFRMAMGDRANQKALEHIFGPVEKPQRDPTQRVGNGGPLQACIHSGRNKKRISNGNRQYPPTKAFLFQNDL